MKQRAAATDERQGIMFADAPPVRPKTSDERARTDLAAMIETLVAAKTHPWSARLLGWQLRTFEALAQRLTPIDAAALRARLEVELKRLGPADD